ncbi:MAG: hypothetical protein GX219_06760 [Tissierellia bacterium]|nr:hypothetical protein [Tissierellia bacterium]
MSISDAMILLGIIILIYTLNRVGINRLRQQKKEDKKFEEWKMRTHTWGSREKRGKKRK